MQTTVNEKFIFNPDVFLGTELESLTENEIIEKYERYINSTIARRFPNNQRFLSAHGLTEDDLIQYGRIGLMRAIRTYEPSKSDFLTHAINCIYWDITREGTRDSLYNKAIGKFDLVDIDSLNRQVAHGESDSDMELMETIPSEIDHFEDVGVNIILEKIKKSVPEKVYNFIKLRIEGYTFEEIGEKYNISRQGVHLTLNRHKDKISKLIGNSFVLS